MRATPCIHRWGILDRVTPIRRTSPASPAGSAPALAAGLGARDGARGFVALGAPS
jgi:hypothetical protein